MFYEEIGSPLATYLSLKRSERCRSSEIPFPRIELHFYIAMLFGPYFLDNSSEVDAMQNLAGGCLAYRKCSSTPVFYETLLPPQTSENVPSKLNGQTNQ
jgi:hypothetical protein